jgi:hypothetical protein
MGMLVKVVGDAVPVSVHALPMDSAANTPDVQLRYCCYVHWGKSHR